MFYSVADYPKLEIFEERWLDIKNEYISNNTQDLLIERNEAAFDETLDSSGNYVPNEGHDMYQEDIYTGKWKVFGFRHRGTEFLSAQHMFPRTMQIFRELDYYVHTAGFSVLDPKTHLNRHHDPLEIEPPKKVMRCHLGLINCTPQCELVTFNHNNQGDRKKC